MHKEMFSEIQFQVQGDMKQEDLSQNKDKCLRERNSLIPCTLSKVFANKQSRVVLSSL